MSKPIAKKCPVCNSTRIVRTNEAMKCEKCGYVYVSGRMEGFKTFEL